MTYQNEFGRSMVEMLGVLAIMGILAMTGVWAYNSAMNRHRANELIYEAQKRATVVAMQITAGNAMLSIGEFKNPAGYMFGVEENPQNANQFNITVSGVEPDVCQQVKNSIEEGSVIRQIDENCTKLTFNNDLSGGTETQCIDSGKIWCAKTKYCSDNGNCCLSGDCAASTCPEGSSTSSGGEKTGVFVTENGVQKECKCTVAGYVFVENKCGPQPSECTSWTANECGRGYYCDFTYTVNDNLNPALGGSLNTKEQACYHDLKGTCAPIADAVFPSTAEMAILKQAGFPSSIVVHSVSTNWWSASSWCVGQGKHLINVSEMQCYRASNDVLVQAAGTTAYCCKQGQSCQQANWNTDQNENALWNGREILTEKADEVAKFGDKMVAIRKVYGETYLWLSSPYKASGSQNSCYVFYINSLTGQVDGGRRLNPYFYALCE